MGRSARPQQFVALLAAIVCFLAAAGPSAGAATEIVRIYGPGGPAPAIREAAAEFSKRQGVEIQVQTGPISEWVTQAKEDADLVFSGSENMMTDLVWAMEGRIAEDTIAPLFLRPAVILVRPGNPKKIGGVKDLLEPDMSLLVVNGAGQNGLWEDIIGRTGDIEKLRRLRKNIAAFARDTAEAAKLWAERPEIDAWLVWNVWSVGDRTETDIVPIEDNLRIYRPVSVALTKRGQKREPAVGFYAFVQSPDGRSIFEKWGWTEKAGKSGKSGK